MSTTPSVGRTLSLRTILQVITALCAALPLALGLIPDVSTAVTVWTLAICGVLAVVINAGWVAYEKARLAPANTTPLTRVVRTTVYVAAAVLTTAATAIVALPIDAGAAAQIAGILAALVVVIAAVWNVLEAAAGGTLTIEPPLPARKA